MTRASSTPVTCWCSPHLVRQLWGRNSSRAPRFPPHTASGAPVRYLTCPCFCGGRGGGACRCGGVWWDVQWREFVSRCGGVWRTFKRALSCGSPTFEIVGKMRRLLSVLSTARLYGLYEKRQHRRSAHTLRLCMRAALFVPQLTQGPLQHGRHESVDGWAP